MVVRKRFGLSVFLVAGSALTFAVAGPASAVPSGLDPSFGSGGVATLPLPSSATSATTSAIAVEPNGDLVLGGQSGPASGPSGGSASSPPPALVVGRLTPAGAPDTTFGTGGVATVPAPVPTAADAVLSGLVLQSDGSIVICVESLTFSGAASSATPPTLTTQATLLRLTPTGTVDSSFGTGGKTAVQPAAAEVGVNGVGVDAADNILVAGLTARDQMTDGNPFVERLTQAGLPDATFGSAGVATVGGPGAGVAVAAAPGGDVILGGNSAAGLSVWAFTATGALDPSFGTKGQALLPLAPLTDLRSLLVAPDGSVFAVGDFGSQAIVAKLDKTGKLVPSFGDGGLTGVGLASPTFATGAALQSNGDILLGGSNGTFSGLAGGDAAWAARFNPDGTPDRTFAADGATTVDMSSVKTPLSTDVGPVISNGTQPVFGGTTQIDLNAITATVPPQQMGAYRLLGGSGTAIAPVDLATRLAGNDRIATAIAISVATFLPAASSATPAPGQASAAGVVVASSDTFPDALVGTPLAASLSAPLLLTHGDSLDSRVADEINRVLGGSGEVTVLGGPGAVNDAVIGQIADLGYSVRRIGGKDRFDTSVQVAQDILSASGGSVVPVPAASRQAGRVSRLAAIERHREQVAAGRIAGHDTPPGRVRTAAAQQSSGAATNIPILEATGTDFPDGVTAGAAAAHIGGVVLLTNGPVQSPEVSQFLLATGSGERFAIGGPAAVADPQATGVVGATRYDTAVKVAEEFFVTPARVGVATGTSFADALAGGSRAAEVGEPVLLTDPATLSAPTVAYLTPLARWIDLADVFGGQGAVSDAVVAAVQNAIKG